MANNNTSCCCPCNKRPKNVETKIEPSKVIEPEIKKKEIPFGYCLIHAGIRTTDDNYTCPVLEIHTGRKAETKKTMNEFSMIQRNTTDPHIGSLREAVQRTVEIEEDIIVIPIESIISIKSSSEVKKGEIESKNVRVRTPSPPPKLSCWKKYCPWCCCRSSKNKSYKKPEEIVTTISNQEAQRKVLFTIQYIRYSNINSPSHVRVLPSSDQVGFFKDHFHMDPLEFYVLHNDVFEQYDFDAKREQASILCRLVTQLKAMVGHYPDESTLQRIINNPDSLAIGDQAEEAMTPFTGPGRINNTFEWATDNERF